ncbi:MAG: GntR family transcriptional regulator [Solirubrobacterales bacterium]
MATPSPSLAPASDATLERNVLREQIKDLILGRILSGEYEPGSRLVETRIAQELGVSQTSVREALRDLEHVGCVVYEPFRGCSVRTFSTAELLEAFPVRAELEALAARLAAERMSDRQLKELAGLYAAMLKAARRRDPHAQAQADARFHAAVARGSDNATLERQWTLLEPYARTYITVERSGTDLVALSEDHLPVLEALQRRDGELAAAAMRAHLLHAAELLDGAAAGER